MDVVENVNVEAVAPTRSWRAVPWAVWVLLVIAGLIVVRSVTQNSFALLGTVAFVAPVVFAAVILYIAPPDRRFVWAALALATPSTVSVLTAWLPDAWLSIAPGDWKNAEPLLQDLGNIARQLSSIAGLVGIALLGIALGGIRTFMSTWIMVFGGFVAAANVLWINNSGIHLEPIDFVRNVGFSVLLALAWAFAFAAALESLRILTLVGSGLVFASLVIGAALRWWQPTTNSPIDLLLVVSSAPAAIGWVLLIAAAVRGELSNEPARSRVGRGSGARRLAG